MPIPDSYVPSSDYVQRSYVKPSIGWPRTDRVARFHGWLAAEMAQARLEGCQWVSGPMESSEPDYGLPATSEVMRAYVIVFPPQYRDERSVEFRRWLDAQKAVAWDEGRAWLATQVDEEEQQEWGSNPYRRD